MIKITIGFQTVEIPVEDDVYAHFTEQFQRKTPNQRRRYTTLMNLVKAAYLTGLQAGAQA